MKFRVGEFTYEYDPDKQERVKHLMVLRSMQLTERHTSEREEWPVDDATFASHLRSYYKLLEDDWMYRSLSAMHELLHTGEIMYSISTAHYAPEELN